MPSQYTASTDPTMLGTRPHGLPPSAIADWLRRLTAALDRKDADGFSRARVGMARMGWDLTRVEPEPDPETETDR